MIFTITTGATKAKSPIGWRTRRARYSAIKHNKDNGRGMQNLSKTDH